MPIILMQLLARLVFRQRVFASFAADLAEAAFAKEIVINQPWTDWKGEHHEDDDWSSGLNACDARHLGAFKRVSDLSCASCVAVDSGIG